MGMGFFVMVLAGLFMFGIGFNALTAHLALTDEGYTAGMVVIGVVVTLVGASALIGWFAALVALVCFGASGLPMIVGGGRRSLARQKRDETGSREIVKELLKDDEKKDGWLYLDPADLSWEASGAAGARMRGKDRGYRSRAADAGDAAGGYSGRAG